MRYLYLDDNFGEIFAQTFLFDVTIKVLIAEFEFEIESFSDVGNARIGSFLGVQFAAENAVGFDADDHVG